jgi:hypothetical protein
LAGPGQSAASGQFGRDPSAGQPGAGWGGPGGSSAAPRSSADAVSDPAPGPRTTTDDPDRVLTPTTIFAPGSRIKVVDDA